MKRLVLFVVALFIVSPSLLAEDIDFVDIATLDNSIVLDIRYATSNNFTGKTVYPVARCLLRRDVALRLLRVEEKLKKRGYTLIVFDCYRPLSVQKRFWEIVPDERYVADPAKGSRHNRGSAVDLTLADLSGNPLPMPSNFDDFSEKAHRDYKGASPEALKNSALLEAAMKEEGFEPFPTEWWHFDAPGWERYPVSDFPLKKSGGCEE
ncbi:MAG: peptidase M15 [Chlorobium sp.]|nr:MAG: peptidase M15 [Chlorobium sp.]